MANRAQAWQKKPEEILFPSGNTALVKRGNVMSMLTAEGTIPDTFYSTMFAGNGKPAEGQEKEYFSTLLKLSSQLAVSCFISPKIVDAPDYEADQISIDDVDDNDKMFLMNWMMFGGEPEQALRRFLNSQQA